MLQRYFSTSFTQDHHRPSVKVIDDEFIRNLCANDDVTVNCEMRIVNVQVGSRRSTNYIAKSHLIIAQSYSPYSDYSNATDSFFFG